MKHILYFFIFCLILSCKVDERQQKQPNKELGLELEILGIMQDGGLPHAGCEKSCCKAAFENPNLHQEVVSLGLRDYENNQFYLFEASPDLPSQMKRLLDNRGEQNRKTPDGIFLSHAHIGHYTGLMYLGRESMNANRTPVYAMPKMRDFLEKNGPWNQLVEIENIEIKELFHEQAINLYHPLKIIPVSVPHRDEYSETVGFRIIGPNKSVLFIPDIDKWTKWEVDIREEIKKVDYAFLDATFFDGNEVKRDISEIPHPFVIESMEYFKDLSPKEKDKIYFIHLNHTNPLANPDSEQSHEVETKGFHIARKGMTFSL